MLDLKTDKLCDSWKEDEGKTFHVLQVLGVNEDLWDRLPGLGSETCTISMCFCIILVIIYATWQS